MALCVCTEASDTQALSHLRRALTATHAGLSSRVVATADASLAWRLGGSNLLHRATRYV